MSGSMLVCDSHSWVRLGAQRQLESNLRLPVDSCAVGELDRKMQQSHPQMLILGVQDETEMARALSLYRQHRKHMKFVLLLAPERQSSARLFFPTAGLVTRDRLSESLPGVVRSLIRGSSAKALSRRPGHRARAHY